MFVDGIGFLIRLIPQIMGIASDTLFSLAERRIQATVPKDILDVRDR